MMRSSRSPAALAPSWKGNLLASATAFCVAVALVIGGGEAVLRSAAPRSDSIKLGVMLPHSTRRYGLKPNLRSLQTGVEVVTNSLGFREKEYPVKKAAGVRRIIVLGDSYTLGVGVEIEDTFSKRMEALLNAHGGAYEVLNFGVNGYNTAMELATLREVAAAFDPDLVLVAYVLNDAERPREVGDQPRDIVPGWSPRGWVNATHVLVKEHSMLYRYLSPKLGEVFGLFGARYWAGKTNEVLGDYDDASVGWANARQALLDIDREARAIHAETLVVVFPLMLDFQTYPLTPIHDKIAQFCGAHGIDVLDLLPRFRNERASELSVFLDGHPNGAAHRIFADAIVTYLRPRLR